MLRKVRVAGFQSLTDVELELGQLTVIVGSTNSGKSSVVRALEAALYNRTGGDFIHGDDDEAEVYLEFDAGTVYWRKPRKGGAHYEVNGRVLTRVGKEIPPEMEAVTGIREIQVEGAKARLQFDGQFDMPFLLASTGGQAAKLLARACKLDVLVTAQVLARRDTERTRRAAVETEERAQALQQELALQPDYEALLSRWQSLQQRFHSLENERAILEEAGRLHLEIKRVTALSVHWSEMRLPQRVQEIGADFGHVLEGATTLNALDEAEQSVRRWRDQVHDAQLKLSAAESMLHDVLSELEICPFCGQSMRR